ncbi:hypothetical protein Tcan_17597 [Toxocara canis]|uniref:Uncharacterized protein n=1 Tax=Toxocara canis TaxID=6265 RepID=A0A0B2VNU1_TOXCA|nr:hypothetical protein Tcan_17597 [Toxocara canis]
MPKVADAEQGPLFTLQGARGHHEPSTAHLSLYVLALMRSCEQPTLDANGHLMFFPEVSQPMFKQIHSAKIAQRAAIPTCRLLNHRSG